jgi:hypothetical protein
VKAKDPYEYRCHSPEVLPVQQVAHMTVQAACETLNKAITNTVYGCTML